MIMTKSVTLLVDDAVIQQAHHYATIKNMPLSELLCTWLEWYGTPSSVTQCYDDLMARLNHVNATKKFNRAEMNERGIIN